MNKVHISVVTQIYACVKSLTKLYERLETGLSKIFDDFEFIIVNDARETIKLLVYYILDKKDQGEIIKTIFNFSSN